MLRTSCFKKKLFLHVSSTLSPLCRKSSVQNWIISFTKTSCFFFYHCKIILLEWRYKMTLIESTVKLNKNWFLSKNINELIQDAWKIYIITWLMFYWSWKQNDKENEAKYSFLFHYSHSPAACDHVKGIKIK